MPTGSVAALPARRLNRGSRGSPTANRPRPLGLERVQHALNVILVRPPATGDAEPPRGRNVPDEDRKSTRLNSSHVAISYAVFCLKKKKTALFISTRSLNI